MDRLILSQAPGRDRPSVSRNPALLYLDTSAWIDIVELGAGERVFAHLSKDSGKDTFLALSIMNFLELIRPEPSQLMRFFSAASLSAFKGVGMIGTRAPGSIVEDEVCRLLYDEPADIALLDQSALQLFMAAFEKGKVEERSWFESQRHAYDEMAKRDRALDLSADINEASGGFPYSSYNEFHSEMRGLISDPLPDVMERKRIMAEKKGRLPSNKADSKNIPNEDAEILKYAQYRIQATLARKHGSAKLSLRFSNPHMSFIGKKELTADLRKMLDLKLEVLKQRMPGLYWMSKITYFNYYNAPQSARGKFGDRNHAIYIPYVRYVGTSDGVLVKALESELPLVFTEGKIRVFRTRVG